MWPADRGAPAWTSAKSAPTSLRLLPPQTWWVHAGHTAGHTPAFAPGVHPCMCAWGTPLHLRLGYTPAFAPGVHPYPLGGSSRHHSACNCSFWCVCVRCALGRLCWRAWAGVCTPTSGRASPATCLRSVGPSLHCGTVHRRAVCFCPVLHQLHYSNCRKAFFQSISD